MFTSITVAEKIAKLLLDAHAVSLNPEHPYTWASGWHSPIYCDNRVTLSSTEIRTQIADALVDLIREKFPQVTAVSGVATGGIPQAALVADRMRLPLSYIRAKAKDHGMQNQIEGAIDKDAKVVVIEDLISTGGSSLAAAKALQAAGYEVLGLVATYSHGFVVAEDAFAEASIPMFTLSDYDHVVAEAERRGFIHRDQVETLKEWRKDPANWGK